ncbi:glycosyl hydrolase [Polaribacter sp. M15]
MKNIKIKQIVSLASIFVMLISSAYAQEIVWTGNASNNDFFDENNWQDSSTSQPPSAGTIDAANAINANLQLSNASAKVVASGVINLGTGSLSVTNSSLEAPAFSGGNVSLNTEAYIDLSDSNPLQNNVNIDFTSGIAWLRTLNLHGTSVEANNLSQITVNGQPATYRTNLRLDNYYLEGTVIRSNELTTKPLKIYDNTNLQGANGEISLDIVHSGVAIANAMNNKTESFILKKGFMATFAITDEGTGPSKNYIASEEDLVVNELPEYLQNDISFIRVIPWNWVAKKGRAGKRLTTDLNNTWNYRWGNDGESTTAIQVDPMSWGAGGTGNPRIPLYIGKYKATHVLGFNEPDDCNAQSGQYNNLCQVDVAVGFYKNLMKTGMRMVSPNGREEAPFGWLKEFRNKANAQDIRIDVIGVHWYDWGSNPKNSPNANPQDIFNRFKNYLQRVYDLYKLPIWITEFNGNPNRSTASNLGFMKLALPYLESLDYVERYAWFQPSSGTADYYSDPEDFSTITDVGTFYRDHQSTPSVPEATISDDSNLDAHYAVVNLDADNLLVNGFFETGDLTGWSGRNSGIINSDTYEGNNAARIISGTGTLLQTVNVNPQSTYDLSLYTKWSSAPSSPISIQILNGATEAFITSKQLSTNTSWALSEMSFTIPNDVTSIIVFISKSGGSPQLLIDNAVLLEDSSLSINDFNLKPYSIFPNPSTGIVTIKGKNMITSYTIFDIQGRLVESKKQMMLKEAQINLTHKSKGIYFIRLTDSNGNQSTEKLVLN